MVIAAAIFPGARVSWARDHAPDPRMLLDLDLFVPDYGINPDQNSNSMLDQIQTLRAMGYLNNSGAPPGPPANPIAVPPPADTEDDIRE